MKKVLRTWFNQQCRMISGSVRGVLLTGAPDAGPYNRGLFWPEKQGDYMTLSLVARAALQNRQAVIKTRNDQVEKTGEPLDALACPLFLAGRLLGVVTLEITHRSQPLQKAAVQQVQAGAKWLETMVRLHGSTAKEQLVHLVDLVAAGLEHEQFQVAASEVANLLAELFDCHRVSLGFLRYNRLRVDAMSHSSQMKQQSNMVRAIREAMVEALDQSDTIVYPDESEDMVQITRFHARLSKGQHGASICTLPLLKSGKTVGALLLERTEDKPFSPKTVEQCEQISLLLGPVLETRRRDERPLPMRALDALHGSCAKLFGPRHLPLKGAATLAATLLIWLSLAHATLHVSCDAVLEPGIRRVVVAPQQGYIAAAHVTAGDLVRKGDLLATLDDQELRLEQRKWLSQRAQLIKEYRKALAGSDRAEVAILNAKRAQTEAQLKLIDEQLARTTLTAPFPGLVVKGDLTQSLGSPVARGEVLYEVAPTDKYRVELEVDDRDIGLVAKGQRGHLKLSGIPTQTIAVTIDRLTPVATALDGRNFFRVDAVMGTHSDLMRPGMEGICKIEIGQKKLLWIWTRRLVDWLRMFTWNRLP